MRLGNLHHKAGCLRSFRDVVQVPRIENWVSRIENWVSRIRENHHQVSRITEI